MGALLGKIDHLTGSSQGNAPGKSRITQGTGIPKINTGGIKKAVAGPRSYDIRHPQVQTVPAIDTKVASSDGKLPSIPRAAKPPKASSII